MASTSTTCVTITDELIDFYDNQRFKWYLKQRDGYSDDQVYTITNQLKKVTIESADEEEKNLNKVFRCSICHLFPNNLCTCSECHLFFCDKCFEKEKELMSSNGCERTVTRIHVKAALSEPMAQLLQKTLKIDCELGCNLDSMPYMDGDKHHNQKNKCSRIKCQFCKSYGHYHEQTMTRLKDLYEASQEMAELIRKFHLAKKKDLAVNVVHGWGVSKMGKDEFATFQTFKEAVSNKPSLKKIIPKYCIEDAWNFENYLLEKDKIDCVAKDKIETSKTEIAKQVEKWKNQCKEFTIQNSKLHTQLKTVQAELDSLKAVQRQHLLVYPIDIAVKDKKRAYFTTHFMSKYISREFDPGNETITYQQIKDQTIANAKEEKLSTENVELIEFKFRNRERDLGDKVFDHSGSVSCFTLAEKGLFPNKQFLSVQFGAITKVMDESHLKLKPPPIPSVAPPKSIVVKLPDKGIKRKRHRKKKDSREYKK